MWCGGLDGAAKMARHLKGGAALLCVETRRAILLLSHTNPQAQLVAIGLHVCTGRPTGKKAAGCCRSACCLPYPSAAPLPPDRPAGCTWRFHYSFGHAEQRRRAAPGRMACECMRLRFLCLGWLICSRRH